MQSLIKIFKKDSGDGLTPSAAIDQLGDEMLSHILLEVPSRELVLKATYVNKQWANILSDSVFWIRKLAKEGVLILDNLKTKLLECEDEQMCVFILKAVATKDLTALPICRNLLKNPYAAEGKSHWEEKGSGQRRYLNTDTIFIVEEEPIGAEPVPPEASPYQQCFVTSFMLSVRSQTVKISKMKREVLKLLEPRIRFSQWVSARHDCGSECYLQLIMTSKDGSEVRSPRVDWSTANGMERRVWHKMEDTVEVPEELTSIDFECRGKDLQFWRGHYGPKTTGCSLILEVEGIVIN